ncbi:MAG: hypothetical protein ACEPOZ_20135 [Marinifilaceae bacterium]
MSRILLLIKWIASLFSFRLQQKCSLLRDEHFRELAVTENYVLGHIEEDAWLVQKSDHYQWDMGDMHGNPSCGLIGPGEDWCMIGGRGIILRKEECRELIYICRKEVESIHDAKLISDYEVKILVDPWSEYAAVWKFDTRSLKLQKLQDGPYLREQAYRDGVDF